MRDTPVMRPLSALVGQHHSLVLPLVFLERRNESKYHLFELQQSRLHRRITMERSILPAFVLMLGSVFLAMLMLVSSHAQAPVNPPNLLSGSDLGFLVEGQQNDRVTGRWMVRVKGQWLPIGGPGTYPAK
jgi:hypothetical protein